MADHIFSTPRNGLDCFMTQSWQSYSPDLIYGFVKKPNNRRRVGIIGAHGTGKTTLSRELANALELPYIEEVARTVHQMGFSLDKQADIRTQIMMWMGQFYEQLQTEEFVADRTLLDVVAYCWNLENNWDNQDLKLVTAISNLTYELMTQQYTHLIYVPIEFAVEDDGVRDLDEQYRARVDSTFQNLLDSFELDYVVVRGSVEKRLHQALIYLGAAH